MRDVHLQFIAKIDSVTMSTKSINQFVFFSGANTCRRSTKRLRGVAN